MLAFLLGLSLGCLLMLAGYNVYKFLENKKSREFIKTLLPPKFEQPSTRNTEEKDASHITIVE